MTGLPRLRPEVAANLAPPTSPTPGYRIGQVLAYQRPQAARGRSSRSGGKADTAPAPTADVYLFGRIGGWAGVTAKDFQRDVGSLDVSQIVLHLNTPGGDALEGVAIANVLRAHKARIVVRVDGLAASAGSVIVAAGDEVVMGLGSQIMVHDPWTVTLGDAAEMEAAARMLHSTALALASTLAAKAGGTTDEWRAVMRTETWYTAEEAVTAGLADRVAAADETGTAEGEQITPGGGGWFWDLWDMAPEETFDLSDFTYAGRAAAPEPAMPGRQTPAAHAGSPPIQERSRAVAFSDEQLNTMRERLNLAADADEAAIFAAITADPDPQTSQPQQAEQAPADRQLPDGVVAIDQSQLEELREQARLGAEARAEQETTARTSLVDAAVRDGRISAARREHWISALAADPGCGEVLAGLERGLVPVDGPKGHDGDLQAAADTPAAVRETSAYKSWRM